MLNAAKLAAAKFVENGIPLKYLICSELNFLPEKWCETNNDQLLEIIGDIRSSPEVFVILYYTKVVEFNDFLMRHCSAGLTSGVRC